MSAWLILVVASLCKVVMALGLKWSAGFTNLRGSAVAILGAAASMWLLALALRALRVGTGYAVWTGLGAVFTAVAGMALLDERRDPLRLAGIAAVVGGVVLLQFAREPLRWRWTTNRSASTSPRRSRP